MKRCLVLLALVFSIVLVDCMTAEARPRRRRARRQNNTYSAPQSNYSFSGGPQAVAESKASTAASRGIKGHLGGGYSGANAEGVGWSTYSAQNALNNCCFTGQRRVAGQSVVRGNDGWYACKVFW